MSRHLRALADLDPADWDGFVRACPAGTVFHLSAWSRVQREVFGIRDRSLAVEEDGAIRAVLPLGLVDRPPFGRALISAPLRVQAGVAGGDAEDRELLEAAALAQAHEDGAGHLELRAPAPANALATGPFDTFARDLPDTADAALGAIPRKQRAEVRKGLKAGLVARLHHAPEPFYGVYARSTHALGSPVFPKTYVVALLDAFGPACELRTVHAAPGRPALAGVLSFTFRETVLPYYGGGAPEARGTAAYPFLYWSLMEDAIAAGLTRFDFGRSIRGSGAWNFKRFWGFEPRPLAYRTVPARGTAPDLDPDTPRNRAAISLWRRLPLPVANRLGPLLYKVVV